MKKNIWLDGMMGLVVGDALGVPVEFTSREERKEDPVTGMREYGTHQQPKGTWSDDSSMSIATMDSIKSLGRVDYKDIMDRFSEWYLHGKYTPFNEVFDIGIATSRAITNYGRGSEPTESGGFTEWDNGNGSLMRILPICLYLYERQKKICASENESIYIVHNASALTHAHLRSQIACGIYYFLVQSIIENNGSLLHCLQHGIDSAYKYYRQDFSNYSELGKFDRLVDLAEFKTLPDNDIKSSGYVIDSIEAAVWCLITTGSYKECVLKAVNFGDDTDTVAAIAGGLAGLIYGYEDIPAEWLAVIKKREWIEGLCEKVGDRK